MAWAGFSENDWINQALRFWDSGPNAVYNTLISVGLTPSEANQVVNKADEIFRASQPPGEPEEQVSEPPSEPTPEPPPPPPVTVTLNSWQKYDANGNIVNKTMGDYTTSERVPFAQNIIDQQKAAGVNLSPAEFTTFAQQQGVPLAEIPLLISKLTFPSITQQQVIDTVSTPVTPIFVPTAPLPENPASTPQPTTPATPTTPTLNAWQKLDANGNIVEKTMADYTTQERIPFAQNVIDQNKLQGKLVTPAEFRTFALAQGVPESQLDALIKSLTFPQQPVVNPTPNPWQTVDQSGNIVQKRLSDYTAAELVPYIQNIYRDNPNATAQMIRQYAASQNVPASVIDAALGSVQVPTVNFSQFTVGGGNTSLATPTTDFFYGAGPTEQAPYMFKSGAAGYTRLLPQSLEFGVPVATGTKPVFTPGIFDKPALQQAYETQTKETYGGEPVVETGDWKGGKITPSDIVYTKGGKVKGLLGPNPSNPDDGYASLQVGEYVIRKKAVNKYGEDFLEALNESRIPKKKAKGLL